MPDGFSDRLSDEAGYLARTCFRRGNGKLPFECVIHSRSMAISVIAHEAVHAACYILDAMGVIADFDNDEVQAYMVQHICEVVENKTNIYGKQE